MQRYQPAAALDPSSFPTDPATGYTSPFHAGFNGCMLCGSVDHMFQGCGQRDTPGAKQAFFRNLFAYKPGLLKSPPREDEIVPGYTPPTTQSFVTNPIQTIHSLPPLVQNPYTNQTQLQQPPIVDNTSTERTSVGQPAPIIKRMRFLCR